MLEDELLDGGMAEGDGCPAEQQEYEPPRKEVGCDEESAGCNEEEEEHSRGESFIGEIGRRSYDFQDGVMEGAEVVHAVLQIAHVPEEVFGHFRGGFDSAGRSYGRAVEGIGAVG